MRAGTGDALRPLLPVFDIYGALLTGGSGAGRRATGSSIRSAAIIFAPYDFIMNPIVPSAIISAMGNINAVAIIISTTRSLYSGLPTFIHVFWFHVHYMFLFSRYVNSLFYLAL